VVHPFWIRKIGVNPWYSIGKVGWPFLSGKEPPFEKEGWELSYKGDCSGGQNSIDRGLNLEGGKGKVKDLGRGNQGFVKGG